MTIRKGDKLLCTKDVNNVFGVTIFKKGETYEVLYVDNEKVKTYIVLNHMEHELEWINNNFKQL